ncbi:MAG: hypothetical protein Fur0043_07500 [Anaerolineales bacterium]
MKLNLEQIESRLRDLVEVKLVDLLPGANASSQAIRKLSQAMMNNLAPGEDGKEVAPNVFTLVVHPNQVLAWQSPTVLQTLIASLKTVGEEAGVYFDAPPTITITQNPEQEEDALEVIASRQANAVADTVGMTPVKEPTTGQSEESLPENAFLIVDGVKVFPLTQAVINIGRRLDNQLVIDDPRISRSHAQLRAIKGRYVLFDLNSTGGTYVNGQKVSQSVLYPGDVISLAGVALVFGQDNPPSRSGIADTSPLQSASVDRPTAVFTRQTGQLKSDDQK